MFTVATTPLRFLGSYVITFATGAAATLVWQKYGAYMCDLGRRDVARPPAEVCPGTEEA